MLKTLSTTPSALPILKPGDSVDIVAPASRCTDEQLSQLVKLLESWQLKCLVTQDIFGEDLFCANTDTIRFKNLQHALFNPHSKAVICVRGGYGSMRLIPKLVKMKPPEQCKIFVGMSDITALHLFFQQNWYWPTIHASTAPNKSPESIAMLKAILFGEQDKLVYADLIPLNHAAEQERHLIAPLTGGNLCLVETSIGTQWQMNASGKIILLEEVGERGYRIDRMLEHLSQAKMFKNAVAILLGDFLKGDEPDGTSLVENALQLFANHCELPVLRVKGIGHGYTNYPIPLGLPFELKLGLSS